MLNVCFGDSECGMLKLALGGEGATFSHRHLEYGSIDADSFEEGRREWIDTFFDNCSRAKRQKIWSEDCQRFKQIIDAARNDGELRIWCAKNPISACGLRHLVYSLQGTDCRIFVVDMPVSVGYREPPFDKSWGEATPYEMRDSLKFERELSEKERDRLTKEWKRLTYENAELRLLVDGKLTSLPVSYLDEEILSRAPRDREFKLGSLVGAMLGESVHCLSDVFIADRIERMIDGGSLVLVGERLQKIKEPYYSTILRVATEADIVERRRKFHFVMDFLSNLDIDTFAIGEAIEDGKLEKSYEIITENPQMTKKQALKKLKLKEYVPNPIPHKDRDYGNKK